MAGRARFRRGAEALSPPVALLCDLTGGSQPDPPVIFLRMDGRCCRQSACGSRNPLRSAQS